jgi:hypothetical protein
MAFGKIMEQVWRELFTRAAPAVGGVWSHYFLKGHESLLRGRFSEEAK